MNSFPNFKFFLAIAVCMACICLIRAEEKKAEHPLAFQEVILNDENINTEDSKEDSEELYKGGLIIKENDEDSNDEELSAEDEKAEDPLAIQDVVLNNEDVNIEEFKDDIEELYNGGLIIKENDKDSNDEELSAEDEKAEDPLAIQDVVLNDEDVNIEDFKDDIEEVYNGGLIIKENDEDSNDEELSAEEEKAEDPLAIQDVVLNDEDVNIEDLKDDIEELYNGGLIIKENDEDSNDEELSAEEEKAENPLSSQNIVLNDDNVNIEDSKEDSEQLYNGGLIIEENDSNDEEPSADDIIVHRPSPFVESRIVGGVANAISNLRYLVIITYNNNFIGGGSLITPTQVLTTAYLIKGLRPALLRVRGGSSFYNQNGTIRGVQKTIIPSVFNATSFNMDVGLLKLRSAMVGTNISPIARCSTILRAGNIVQISGWGTISGASNVLSPQVRSVNVPLISGAQCQAIYLKNLNFRLSRSMMCSSTAGLKGVCGGDAGGPVVRNNQLCGLISFGYRCTSGYPDVYTALSAPAVRNFTDRALAI